MGWEKRHLGGRGFYYRAERRNGKVVKTYVGPRANPAVELVARIDRNRQALDRLNRISEAADDTAEHDQLLRADDARADLVNDLLRRRREMKVHPSSCPSASSIALPSREDFLVLVHRADDGDEHARTELINLLDGHPELWKPFGDLGSHVEDYLIDLASKGSTVLRESVRRHFEKVRATFLTVDQDPLEAFLVHRVIASHLDVLICQTRLIEARSEGANRRRQRQLDQGQRRLIESVEALQRYQKERNSSEIPDPAAESAADAGN